VSGYSGTPLLQKLGIKPGHRLFVAPRHSIALLGKLPAVMLGRRKGPFDVMIVFVTERCALKARFANDAKLLHPAGGLWIAWPKKSSGVLTDVTEDVVREIALAEGLVDNKVCAIDEVWSGLRCVVRVKDRFARAK